MTKLLAIGLLLLGLLLWPVVFGRVNAVLISFGTLGPWWLAVFALACMAGGWLPPIAGPLHRLMGRFRNPSLRARTVVSVVIGISTSAYLWTTAASEHRQFFPYIHDEFSYLIQAHQLAEGRLWMPAHLLAQFFDSFQLIVRPVYASAYFPGTALWYVPGVWLHVPAFVSSLVAAGLVAGLCFWIAADLLDAIAGVLAVLLLIGDGVYRQMSIVTMGQMPLLLYGLLAIVAWLRWRATGRSGWSVLVGFFLGLAAITRPVDALCYAIPIGVFVLIRQPKKSWLVVAGAMPLLCLQMILNHGVTGHWLQTPFGLYADRDYPGTRYGFHLFDPSARPMSDLPQKQALYFQEYLPLIQQHRPGNILSDLLTPHPPFNVARLRQLLSQSSPQQFPLLFPLLLLSLRGLNAKRSIVLVAIPLFALLYIPYVFFFPHYVLGAAPALILGILVGAAALGSVWQTQRRFLEVGLTLFIAGVAIAALPQWASWNEDVFDAPLLASVNQQLAALPHRPAAVLFKYDFSRNTHEEPVYNADVAWPDDAEVIRAHDLGDSDQLIFDYYAAHQPERFFYRFDERDRSMHALGTAAQLGRAKTN